MPMFKTESTPKEIETVIGPSVKVDGNFIGQGNVVVEGVVNGSIKTQHNLRVGKDAKIKADVEAANLSVAGEIKGNIRIKEKTELANTARIFGNLETKLLMVEEGAIIHGKCIMVQELIPQESKKVNKP